ncbi:hypothetical protein ACVWW7_003567 [Bradyrhizobium sp. LM6.9]
MAHLSQSLSFLTEFARPRRLALLAVLATAALPSTADARGYDGVWNVTFATTRGNCSSGYSVPFTVAGRPGVVRRRWPGLRQGQSQRCRRGRGLRRGVPCQRRRPAREVGRNRLLARHHFRRPLQRHLAGDKDVTVAQEDGALPLPLAGEARKQNGPPEIRTGR